MTLENKSITDPGLLDVLSSFKLDIFRSMNCIKIGKIISFNRIKKTAAIQLLFKRVLPSGAITSYPVLVDCPVFTLQGGGASIEMPIAAGDQCIVLFADRNIDVWFKNGSEAAPSNARSHDISDGIALVGVNALTSSLPNYEPNIMKILFGMTGLIVQDEIVTIKNSTTTLLTLLNSLITVIEGIQVNGPLPLTAPSVAALEAVKVQLATLLG